MHTKCAASVTALCLLTPTCHAAAPQSPKVVADKTGVNDVMNFLGIHSWKVRVVGPLHSVSVEAIQYVRSASGQFVPVAVLGQNAVSYSAGAKQVDVVAMFQAVGNRDRFGLAVQGGGSPPTDFPKSVLAGYIRFGNGSGGDGLKVGGEHILMAKYYNPRVTTASKKDMSAYVALRITARK